MLRRISCAASLALTAVSTGCLTDPELEPSTITRVASTDQQQAPGGSRLPLRVRVTVRTANGTATVRAEVLWSILSQPGEVGGGRLSDSLTLSDGTGLAEVEITLGRTEGVTTVRAVLRADKTQSVDLTITATRTPVLTGVSPTSFGGGDQIVVSGSNLDVATGFEVGGVVVVPIAVSGDGGDATLPVPQCLTPGQVAIRAFAGTAISDTLFGVFSAAAGSIALGIDRPGGRRVSVSLSQRSGGVRDVSPCRFERGRVSLGCPICFGARGGLRRLPVAGDRCFPAGTGNAEWGSAIRTFLCRSISLSPA